MKDPRRDITSAEMSWDWRGAATEGERPTPRDDHAGGAPMALERCVTSRDLIASQWPMYSIEAAPQQLIRVGEMRILASIVPSFLAVAFMLAVCLESLWIVGAAGALGVLMLLGLRRTRAVKERVRRHATAALRTHCENHRTELVVQLGADDRKRLERLESMVEYLRRLVSGQRQTLDDLLVERLDRLLHHYVRLAVDRQRVQSAYRLVEAAAPRLVEAGAPEARLEEVPADRIATQQQRIRRMRQQARDDFERQQRSASSLLHTIAELVTLVYEQCLCRQLVVDDVSDRIDHLLEEFARFGDARIEAEDAARADPCTVLEACGR